MTGDNRLPSETSVRSRGIVLSLAVFSHGQKGIRVLRPAVVTSFNSGSRLRSYR